MLPVGKVNPYELAELIFPQIKSRDEILVEPGIGQDGSVIELEKGVLVLSSDPITGALKNPGWLSVKVNANDVAAMGASPKWYLINLFLPKGSKRSDLKKIVEGVQKGCEEMDISLVGGHTEVTPGLERTLVSGAMIGTAPKNRWVSASDAQAGDKIIITKTAAIEGTYILALDREEVLKKELDESLIQKAQNFRQKISIVTEAITATKSGEVHAMHDVTEGGLLGGLHELADASGKGFSINSNDIPVAEETQEICEYFNIDPFRTISSGTLIICTPLEDSSKIIKSLKKEDIKASEIGEIVDEKEVREMDGEPIEFPEQDELWKVF
ncbi:hypothetical protein AKJ52_03060 [candidate division MSBL1 archaeon SCGC-AAA382C18]|uniref:Hydrogenase n=1 Tax=candidate division MSBL1 archaeon SCGC-AAA382C18 TaxID=1698281 RepID=A0A133VH58_9EURY|nr:hypothetical protein AKJ52_03060 [candidate division MSBL1 archaeon SCGC-AAA382C18]